MYLYVRMNNNLGFNKSNSRKKSPNVLASFFGARSGMVPLPLANKRLCIEILYSDKYSRFNRPVNSSIDFL